MKAIAICRQLGLTHSKTILKQKLLLDVRRTLSLPDLSQFGLIKGLAKPSPQISASIVNSSCRNLSQFDMLASNKVIFLCW